MKFFRIQALRLPLVFALVAASFAHTSFVRAQGTQAPAPQTPTPTTPAPVSVRPATPQDGAQPVTQTGKGSAFTAASVTELDVNGLKVLVKRRQGSQSVSAGLYLRGGSRNLTPANAGIETLMLAAATEASTGYPRERLRDELARLNTNIGFDADPDYSALTLTSTRDNFDRSWTIFADVAIRPRFDAGDVELMRERIISSLRESETTPDASLESLQQRIAYAGHPYANRPEGTIESVTRLKVEDLRRHHTAAMQTARLLLVVVGDLDASEVRTRVERTFGRLPRGTYTQPPAPALAFDSSTIEVVPRRIETNYVQGVFSAPPLTSDDIYPMRVATVLLRDRVFTEVRVRRNLSYAPNAFLGTQGANIGGIYVTSTDANQAVRVMLNEITGLQSSAVAPSEISAVVALFLTTYYLGQETNAAQAGELATYELIGGGWRDSFEVLDRLRRVTPEDVRRVARNYMRNIRFVAVGNPEQIDRTIFTNFAVAPADRSDALKALGIGN